MKTYLCSHLISLHSADGQSIVNLERISESHASVNAEAPVEAGHSVTLVADEIAMAGMVERCSLGLTGYEIEIALTEAWSPERFQPDHFFDPDVMIAPR